MKTLVVYYSRSGTTKKIADEICDKMNCDIEEIIDNKNRKGLFGWLIAAFDARSKKLTVIENIKNDPSKYDLVISICSSINPWLLFKTLAISFTGRL